MKNLFTLFIFLGAFVASSQNSASVFTGDAIVYYGMDFSNSRLIGDFKPTNNAHDLKTNLFPQWNEVVANTPAKFNFKAAFHKTTVYNDLKPVTDQNAKTDEQNLLVPSTDHVIDKTTIQKMVSNYGQGDKNSGIGLVFIIEAFDRTIKLATIHVVFFDIASHKVLFSEKMRELAGGSGLKKYWTKAIRKGLKEITKTEYAQWEKKYKGK